MKNLKIITLVALVLTALSCGKKFEDLNVDPNNPQSIPADFLITDAQHTMANQMTGIDQAYFTFLWGQYFSQNNYTEESRYLARPNAINLRWENYYAVTLYDLAEARRLVQANPGLNAATDGNKLAIVDVLMAMRFQDLTDIFGPVPYSDALKGSAGRTPKYDGQREIYLDLSRKLKDAASSMDEFAGGFGDADIIYFGDAAKWKKLANSLRMRVAMRMADREDLAARAEVEAAWAGAFTSNDDNAAFHFLTAEPNNNSLNSARVARIDADFGMSNILVDRTLKPLNDPRLPVFADEKVNGGGFVGRPYGQSSGTAASDSPDNYSQPSGAAAIRSGIAYKPHDVLAPDAVGKFMSYAEVCFIMAEAIERGWSVPGTAAEWYEKGITASLDEWGIADASAYLAQPSVAYATAASNWKQKIGVQKWIALYLQGSQGWSEWRRLNFDKFELPVDGTIGDVGSELAPLRLTWPTNEQAQNSSNYQAAIGLLGGPDKLTTRVWWDMQ